MGLADLVRRADSAMLKVIGNRMTVAAMTSITGGVYVLVTGALDGDALQSMFGFTSAMVGSAITGQTACGTTTPVYYARTRAHIEANHGRLDRRFAMTIIEGSENRAFVGYCQQQGLYLAARDTGNLDVWREAHETYSNVRIPFF